MIFNIIILFVFGGWFIGKIVQLAIPKEKEENKYLEDYKESPTVINNYTTNIQNNLNITDEQLKKLRS